MDDLRGKRVLVVDDEPEVRKLLVDVLAQVEARVFTAGDGREALRQFYTRQPDLILLDVMMPHMDGWDVCRDIRKVSDVPIIMLTALGQEDHIVGGLDWGADDYIVKPFSPDVLLARARAVLRRATCSAPTEKPIIYDDGYLTVDSEHHSVLVRGELVPLTPTEFKLLAYLLQNAGLLLTYEQILANAWDDAQKRSKGYVRSYVSRLRKKLEADPRHPRYLLSEHGIGYRFETRIRWPE